MASPPVIQQDLSSLIMRATNPLNEDDDPNMIQAICQEVGNDVSKIQVAVRLIVHKMQSPHEREALQALLVLQACINNCGANFHSEVGKFRFLNEMIKLVSPKYYGNQTADDVKKKVVELLYTWTLDLKLEPKIVEAYEMLKKQGVVKEDPNYLGALPVQPALKIQQPASFEDEKKSRLLQRLLQSKRPEDISKANALIKHMVKEDERRMERSSRRIVEVETALNNVKVLDEMLTQYNKTNSAKQSDLELMEELFSSCQALRSNIYRIVSEMEDKEDGIGELLKASDELSRVMGRYKLETEGKSEETKRQPNAHGDQEKRVEEDTLLDLSPDIQPIPIADSLGMDELGTLSVKPASDDLSDISNSPDILSSTSVGKKESLLDELEDVFGNNCVLGKSNSNISVDEINSNLLRHSLMQQPISPLIKNQPVLDTINKATNDESPKPMNDLDLLGSSLLRESLPSNIGPIGSQFKMQEKVSLNQLKQKSKLNEISTVIHTTPLADESPLQLSKDESNINSLVIAPAQDVDLLSNLVLSSMEARGETIDQLKPLNNSNNLSSNKESSISHGIASLTLLNAKNETEIVTTEKARESNVQLCEVKPMNNIHVALEDIKPGKQSSISLLESNGVSVILHFTDNKPRDDVSIIVVSVTSRNLRPISNYVLQAVGPKGCKVRLQPPSSTTLAEYSPFLPPSAITQIMLIANPNQLNVSLKVMLSYSIDDEPLTDMGEIENLPL